MEFFKRNTDLNNKTIEVGSIFYLECPCVYNWYSYFKCEVIWKKGSIIKIARTFSENGKKDVLEVKLYKGYVKRDKFADNWGISDKPIFYARRYNGCDCKWNVPKKSKIISFMEGNNNGRDYIKESDTKDENEEYLKIPKNVEKANTEDIDERDGKTFCICGTDYKEKEIILILRNQILQFKEYSHFSDAEIEFAHENKNGDIFFYLSNDDGEDMMVKIGQDEKVYWDWNGSVLDDD